LKLTRARLADYLTRAGVSLDRLDRVRKRYDDGERDYANTYLDDTGAINVNDYGEGSILLVSYGEPTAILVPEVMERVRELNAQRMGLRITAPSEAFRDALLDAGFRDLGDRIEFKAEVEALPDDEGTPLAWRNAGEQAAGMLARVAENDPHGEDERNKPVEMLANFSQMREDPGCFQIGCLDGEDVAFVCAQVAPKDGWSRIAYMGLVPAARRKGLGRWLHRHGFAMIKEQGGKLYHGGTAASNKGMLALFKAHGCHEFKRMTEFTWHA